MDLQKSSNWKPSQQDIDRLNDLIQHINPNGIWGVPANGSIWRLDHARQVVWLISAGLPNKPVDRIIDAFKAVGWCAIVGDHPGNN